MVFIRYVKLDLQLGFDCFAAILLSTVKLSLSFLFLLFQQKLDNLHFPLLFDDQKYQLLRSSYDFCFESIFTIFMTF